MASLIICGFGGFLGFRGAAYVEQTHWLVVCPGFEPRALEAVAQIVTTLAFTSTMQGHDHEAWACKARRGVFQAFLIDLA